MPLTTQEKLRLCQGCRDNFYNNNPQAIGGMCCKLKGARKVRRWKLAWWTRPTEPRAFEEVVTLDCHHEPGRYAFSSELPGNAVSPRRIARTK